MFCIPGIVSQQTLVSKEAAILTLLSPKLFYVPRNSPARFQNITTDTSHFLDFSSYPGIISQSALITGFDFSWNFGTSGWNTVSLSEKYLPVLFNASQDMSFFMYIKLPDALPTSYITFFSFRSNWGSSPSQYDFDIEIQRSPLAFFSAMNNSAGQLSVWISNTQSSSILGKTCLVIYRRSGSQHNLFVNQNAMLSHNFAPPPLILPTVQVIGINEGMRMQCFGFCNYAITDTQVTSLKEFLPSGLT